jgi:hypothetical protein
MAEIGRPPIFKTAEEMQKKVDAYFESLKRFNKDGEEIEPRPPTIAGLAYYLGFLSRGTIYEQDERGPEFSDILKKARLFIESFHEERMTSAYPTGSIFWLKNHAWKDTQAVDLSGGVQLTRILDDVPKEKKE